jgi:hypothetical protein
VKKHRLMRRRRPVLDRVQVEYLSGVQLSVPHRFSRLQSAVAVRRYGQSLRVCAIALIA